MILTALVAAALHLSPLPVQPVIPSPFDGPREQAYFGEIQYTRWSTGNIDAMMVQCPNPAHMHWSHQEVSQGGIDIIDFRVACW
jgi:hypothetical protein